MLALAVGALLASGVVDRVVVIVQPELVAGTAGLLPEDVTIIAGGPERSDSVRNGIGAAPDAAFFLVHDAARALAPPALFVAVAAELRAGRGAVIPVLPVADTIKSVDDSGLVTGTPPRAGLRAVQTPQGFAAALLRRAHETATGAVTDDATLVERLGEPVHTIVGDPLAFKITTQLDLTLARALTKVTV
jgi:2-C-methyl-D-erythritol 4-phosphate cytidylyltransferase